MVIYNHNKEFVGIEEKDLRALKLNSLAELQNEAADFADLFVKTPGHIHNFQHVHWIDFVASADSVEENRVIIGVKGRRFKANLEMQKLFLVDAPQSEAYGIVLVGIHEITEGGVESSFEDIARPSVAKPVETTPPPYTPPVSTPPEPEIEPTPSPEIVEDPYATMQSEPEPEPEIEEEPLTLDLDFDLEPTPEKEEKQEKTLPQKEEEPVEVELDVKEEAPVVEASPYLLDDEDKFRDYHYNPEIVAKELGLPDDLVEEFIQDFIAQAHEFKPDLYEALSIGRIDNLRMLSHKLKGVAANLRIEDAFDALVTINTSDDIDLVKRTMDHFYGLIIPRLAGEEIKVVSASQPQQSAPSQPEQPAPAAPKAQEKQEEPSQNASSKEEKIELDMDVADLLSEEEEPQEVVQQAKEEAEEKLDLDILDEEEEPLELAIKEEEPKQEEKASKVEEVEPIKIDKEHIASELGIDVATYEELLDDYVSDMQGGLVQLEDAVANGELGSAKKLALRLKGMSDNMHLERIAKDLERFIKDDQADKTTLLQKIKIEIDSIEGI